MENKMIYLYNDLHEIAVRIDTSYPEDDVVFAKMKGEKEAPVKTQGSKTITDAMIENNRITKEKYDAF